MNAVLPIIIVVIIKPFHAVLTRLGSAAAVIFDQVRSHPHGWAAQAEKRHGQARGGIPPGINTPTPQAREVRVGQMNAAGQPHAAAAPPSRATTCAVLHSFHHHCRQRSAINTILFPLLSSTCAQALPARQRPETLEGARSAGRRLYAHS